MDGCVQSVPPQFAHSLSTQRKPVCTWSSYCSALQVPTTLGPVQQRVSIFLPLAIPLSFPGPVHPWGLLALALSVFLQLGYYYLPILLSFHFPSICKLIHCRKNTSLSLWLVIPTSFALAPWSYRPLAVPSHHSSNMPQLIHCLFPLLSSSPMPRFWGSVQDQPESRLKSHPIHPIHPMFVLCMMEPSTSQSM
ncbi:hypothetical protein QR685DRAFT_511322 [Neurospora intermedia]|uniref:Uncharacterized protein n=1 Tax=Neurospora intermedia TaxID=5142 RepID=A0ABR3DQM9_NEUIN